MPTPLRNVRSQEQSGNHMLALSFSGFDRWMPRRDGDRRSSTRASSSASGATASIQCGCPMYRPGSTVNYSRRNCSKAASASFIVETSLLDLQRRAGCWPHIAPLFLRPEQYRVFDQAAFAALLPLSPKGIDEAVSIARCWRFGGLE